MPSRTYSRKPAVDHCGHCRQNKSVIMKKSNVVVNMIVMYVIGLSVLFFVLSFASCSAPHWYKATGDGCRQSAGFAGFGNKK